ncbi:hypothetical protein Mgra_00001556 [Meloidogyne graminicola]|uniref:Uncharacterized protein n=1 Tax=Meloidogyne graminicola TaxID=189291 RepID=A0A8T0A0F8_9BILA|nr:hypothetical protein Mgra_00001556 [Meloidogyne graminicola]
MRTTMQLIPTLIFYFIAQMNVTFMQTFLYYTNNNNYFFNKEIIVNK